MKLLRWILAIPIAFVLSTLFVLLYSFVVNILKIDTGFFSENYLPSFLNGLLFVVIGVTIVPNYKFYSSLVLLLLTIVIVIVNPYSEGVLSSGSFMAILGSVLGVLSCYIEFEKNK